MSCNSEKLGMVFDNLENENNKHYILRGGKIHGLCSKITFEDWD